MRWLRRLVVGLVVILVVAAAAGVWLVRRSYPVTDGTVEVAGLEGPVTVTRDVNGHAHIAATTNHDLYMAQGYVHAQDRFWQMDTWRHIGAGRLAEMFGEGQIETDAFLRTLGFERLAEEEYETAPTEVRSTLEAYADGVNAYLDERPGGSGLSLEYAVLGLQNSGYVPSHWEPVDSLTWAHVMAWDLRSNMDEEIERARLTGILGAERTEELYPRFPADHAVIVPGEGETRSPRPAAILDPSMTAALDRVVASVAGVESMLGGHFDGIGSNNWVVAGNRTASGLPLLANDPHLPIQLPSIWYQATLWCVDVVESCPQRVTGFSFPGAPGVVIGHNERIAWGVTNLGPDTMDLYIERTDGDRYEVEGEWVDFEVRTETLRVAGGEDVEIDVRSTRHGPVISGRYGDLEELAGSGFGLPEEYEITLAWQALKPSTLFESLLAMNHAGNWEEFRAAASLFDIAPQNLVYADVDGHIGYQASGEIPIRSSSDGRYPVPGWTADHEWEGLIPFADLPFILDPPSGMIVTANQPVVDESYPGFIGTDHAYGFRARRITELLADSESVSVEDMTAIQLDDYDASAATVVPAFLSVESDDPVVTGMQTILDRWASVSEPYRMSETGPGAAAYAALWRHLLAGLFDELPEDLQAAGGSRYFELVRLLVDVPDDPWWDVVGTPEVETVSEVMVTAARAAHAELVETLGDDPDGWRWGDLHRARFENQTLGQSGLAPIEAIFNRTAPPIVGGGSAIVDATSWTPAEGYEVTALPSLRMVVDLGDFGQSVAIHPGGQSGHVFHPHYFDQTEPWAMGASNPLPFDPAQLTADAVLELVPG